MSNLARNYAIVLVVFLAGAVVITRQQLHNARTERAANERLRLLKADRERAFADRCRAAGGKTLYGCPDLCVQVDAVMDVLP